MLQQFHRSSRCGPLPRTEQDGGLDLELSETQLAVSYPEISPTPGPISAHRNVSTPSYGQQNSHDSSARTAKSGPFNTPSAFGLAHPAQFSMQPSPAPNSVWIPTASLGWQVPNMDPLNTQSLIAAHAAALGQGTPILLSSPSPGPSFNSMGASEYPGQTFGMASNTTAEAPLQPHQPVTSLPTRGHSAFWRRGWQLLRGSPPQDIKPCLGCRYSHKQCDGGTPCLRCERSTTNSALTCRYGLVFDAAAEIPFLCHMPRGASSLRADLLPRSLQPAAHLLSRAKKRQCQAASQLKRPGYVVGSHDSIFCRVVNIQVPNIRVFVDPLEPKLVEMGVLLSASRPQHGLPYDELIVSIVWEVVDNPDAQLTGVGTVEDLVALLEAASLCEARWGPNDRTKRLVYNSMCYLLHCMQALRLSADGLLAADADAAHAHCAQAQECTSPALHGITRYALRYAEALSTALFNKRRSKDKNWLLVFYSLYIQGYVRCALMALEQRWPSVELSAAGGVEVERGAQRLRSASYLQTAVFWFGKFSMKGGGTLAKSIQNERPEPSVYLQEPLHSSQAGGDSGDGSWQQWRNEGASQFLGRIYQIPIDDSTTTTNNNNNHQRHTEPPRTSADSDSEGTIIFPFQSEPPPPSGELTAAVMDMAPSTAEIAAFGVSNTDTHGWGFSSPVCSTPEPSILGSTWSETSYEGGSETSTSYAASLSTLTTDNYITEDDFGFETWREGTGIEHYAEEYGDAFMNG